MGFGSVFRTGFGLHDCLTSCNTSDCYFVTGTLPVAALFCTPCDGYRTRHRPLSPPVVTGIVPATISSRRLLQRVLYPPPPPFAPPATGNILATSTVFQPPNGYRTLSGHKNSCTIDTISIAQRSYITFIMLFSLLMPLPADPDRRIPVGIFRTPPRQRAHRRQCQYTPDSAQPTEQL